MRATYRNSIRSKQLIREAMISLLNKKSLTEITVSDIVKTADINRGTFYNHYGNPIDVLEEIKEELMQKLSNALKLSKEKNDVDSFINIILEHFKKNDLEYRKIVDAIPMSVIDKMKQEFINKIVELKPGIDNLSLYLIVNGISGLYLDYLKNNITFSYDELGATLKQFVNFSLQISNQTK